MVFQIAYPRRISMESVKKLLGYSLVESLWKTTVKLLVLKTTTVNHIRGVIKCYITTARRITFTLRTN